MTKTVIHKNDLPYFGDEPLLEIAPERSFSSMIFELLSGHKPAESEGRLFELILNMSIDHGPETPSAVEVIKAAKDGKTISESVAAGLLQINNTHGGAIEPAMEFFYKVDKEKLDIKKVVEQSLANGERLPGFGHRIYELDPRSQLIFKTCREFGIGDHFITIAEEFSETLTKIKGKALPVNIDGAIAAALCGMGWDSKLGKAVFIIARTPGLCGQYLNAKETK